MHYMAIILNNYIARIFLRKCRMNIRETTAYKTGYGIPTLAILGQRYECIKH